jgi:choline dehydrogenase
MPYVTNANIYAPVMMLAEKAADLIKGDTPLAPEPLEFYVHGVSPPPRPREPVPTG